MPAPDNRKSGRFHWRAGASSTEKSGTQTLKARSVGDIIRSNVFTRFNALLGGLCLVVLIAGQWQDALFGGVLVANTAIGILQELRSRQKLARLALLSQPKVRVRRSSAMAEVSASELVVGDHIEVAAGDQIVVDGIVSESGSLEIDESLLTGESEAVAKTAGASVMSGSFVVSGQGNYRATRVGSDAYAHRLAAEARRFEPTRSQLRAGIDIILRHVGWAIAPVSLLLVVNQLSAGVSAAKAVVFSAGGVVGMVPEGLVLLTSVAMATGAMRLAKRNALTQELAATETLARVDVLCLDKTGTLTTGKPFFERVEMLTPNTDAISALGALAGADLAPNATLRAIAVACPALSDWRATEALPFSAARKWSAASFEGRQTWVLGAPDVLLPSSAPNEGALQLAAQYASSGNRVLLLGTSPQPLRENDLPTDLQPVALVLLGEELKEDALAALGFFAKQGVAVKVISGDHAATAGNVARRAGLKNSEIAFDARNQPEHPESLKDAVERHTVFGRTTPQHKKAMVAALQANGHTVAMIGDGVNDVLALKQADIGIAMGSGSGAARTVAQLVLVDDRLASLPAIVGEGRRIIGNVERLANLFVTKTVYAMLLAIAVGIADLPFPFLPRHLTLVGALTIGIPAFLLSMEAGGDRVKPGFIGRVMRFAVPAGLVAAIGTFAAYFTVFQYENGGLESARTMAAIALFCVALWTLYLLSRPVNLFRALSIGAMTACFVLVVALRPLRTFFNLSLPSPMMLLTSAVVVLVATFALKRVVDKLSAATFAPGSEIGMSSGQRITWHLIYERIGVRNLLVATVLVIGGVWLFFGVLEDVVSHDPLVDVDVAIHAAMQRLRFPALDSVMVAASELGDAAVTVPVIFVVLGWFVWQRELRSALYWIAAIGLAEVFVETVKFVIQRPRPTLIYEGVHSFSFPSNHATLSVVTYGLLAYFVARTYRGVWRQRIAIAAGLLIALISFSRLYLGAHWFSDILAGISFGIACIASVALLHHVGDGGRSKTLSLGVATMVALLLTAGTYIFMQHSADLIRYAPR
ncbi:HAD-IC family P-type ATPase [Paraburkholderia sp. UYCP14C]|uniref:HAD-IC family P-type ATPase n=1 Tax=Paraburkholderia sp. UYCP14C TaxID=2511130 RepID=UPI0020070C50|nr:HAD-IC family P-type ATPase [Paraburkholderia sp. UYCP14C]